MPTRTLSRPVMTMISYPLLVSFVERDLLTLWSPSEGHSKHEGYLGITFIGVDIIFVNCVH